MNIQPPNHPTGDLQTWARSITDYLWRKAVSEQQPSPQIVSLEHIKPEAKALENGILMWDEDAGTVVVSKDGAWRQLVLV